MKPVNQLAKAAQLTDENIPLRPPRSGNGGRCRRRFGRSGRSVVDEDHLLAQILGGSASDYESDLTITDADVPGLAVTARGRTPQRCPSIGDRRRRGSLFDVRRSQRNDFRRVHVHRRSTGELTDLWSVARPHQVYACSRSAARATACSKVWTSTARRATL